MVTVRSDVRATHPDHRLDRRQWLILSAPLALIASTLPVFHLARAVLGEAAGGQLAWFVGMTFYWIMWGGVFPLRMLGGERVRELLRPLRPTAWAVAHVTFVVAMAAAVRFLVPGMGYAKPTVVAVVLLTISPFANGLCEELLWRGVYLDAFPDNVWLRAIWASLWFGLWHLVPGSISVDGPHIAMVIGPTAMGLYFAFLTRKTGSIWWPIVAHTLGGLVMVS